MQKAAVTVTEVHKSHCFIPRSWKLRLYKPLPLSFFFSLSLSFSFSLSFFLSFDLSVCLSLSPFAGQNLSHFMTPKEWEKIFLIHFSPWRPKRSFNSDLCKLRILSVLLQKWTHTNRHTSFQTVITSGKKQKVRTILHLVETSRTSCAWVQRRNVFMWFYSWKESPHPFVCQMHPVNMGWCACLLHGHIWQFSVFSCRIKSIQTQLWISKPEDRSQFQKEQR